MTRIRVYGTGHLASATLAGCLKKGYEIVGPASFEPPDLVWFCVNTPVDDNDRPDTLPVLHYLIDCLAPVNVNTPVLISSQLPVGTMAEWQKLLPSWHLSYVPENIRVKHAYSDFLHQDRMILGTNWSQDIDLITSVLEQFAPVMVMSPESAEMVKHTLNVYLAMCIVFANEVGDICEIVGADIDDTFSGFRTDRRVSDFAPLIAGGPYEGGTLGRDVRVLMDAAGIRNHLIYGIHLANDNRL